MPINSQTSDVLIVGSGVLGLSLAWELAKRGQQVRVIESGAIGKSGASWAGAGILPSAARSGAVDPYDQLKSLSHSLHEEWAAQLYAETGIDTGFRKCGGIYLASTRAEAATLAAQQSWYEEHAIACNRLRIPELLELEPLLERFAPEILAAWSMPEEYQLRNPHHLQALAAACSRRNVDLVENSPVQSIDSLSSTHVQVTTPGRRYTASQVCICSGAWARQLLEAQGMTSGIMPVRGQMLLYRAPQPLLRRIINEGNRYLVPRLDGHLLAGSVEEEVGYVNETTETGLKQIRDWAERVLPVLQTTPLVKTWSGLRPGSYDGLPYIGQVPHTENLFVAAGHFRSGLHLSCGTAVELANVMLGQSTSIDLQCFRVGRG